jgi:hypothetical protein
MNQWAAYRNDQQLVGAVNYDLAKSVLLDHLSSEADNALDNNDLPTRAAADDAWAELEPQHNTAFEWDVNGVVYALRLSP